MGNIFTGPLGLVIGGILLWVSLKLLDKAGTRKWVGWSCRYAELVTVHPLVKRRVTVRFGRKNVSDVGVAYLKVLNLGNRNIEDTDYESLQPLIFNFGGAKVLDVAIVQAKSDSLREEAERCLKWNNTSVQLGPLALRIKDSLTIKVYVSEFKGTPTQNTGITGGEILDTPEVRKQLAISVYGLVACIVAQAAGVLIDLNLYHRPYLIPLSAFLHFFGFALPFARRISIAQKLIKKRSTLRGAIMVWIVISAILTTPIAAIASLGFFLTVSH